MGNAIGQLYAEFNQGPACKIDILLIPLAFVKYGD